MLRIGLSLIVLAALAPQTGVGQLTFVGRNDGRFTARATDGVGVFSGGDSQFAPPPRFGRWWRTSEG